MDNEWDTFQVVTVDRPPALGNVLGRAATSRNASPGV